MMNYIFSLLLVVFTALTTNICLAHHIPIAVTKLQSAIIDGSVMRVIGYNMEIDSKIEIERLQIPGPTFAENAIIKEVKVNDKVLNFAESTATILLDLSIDEDKGHVIFALHYLPLAAGPEDLLVECRVDVKNNQIGQPFCVSKPWPYDS